jgi:hypothetical protein
VAVDALESAPVSKVPRVPAVPRVGLILTAAFGLLAGCRDRSWTVFPTERPNQQPAVVVAPAPPAAPVAAKGCGLPRGTGSGEGCPREQPSFLPQVEAALDRVVREHPDYFDLARARGCPNCYLVLQPKAYLRALVSALEDERLCATDEDGEELAVKNTNAWNDQYDVLTGEFFIRRQGGSYRATCYPAWF